MRVYLDNSATTKANEEVAAAVCKCLTEDYGNPSSVHEIGQDAERVMKQGRLQIAIAAGAKPANVIFTGSGTEANNLALHTAFRNPARFAGRKLLLSAIEHAAVHEPAAYLESLGVEVVRIPVMKARREQGDVSGFASPGVIDVNFLKEAMDESVAMISVMHVNNETGVIQPIDEICKLKTSGACGADTLIHTDAVQSFCKLPINMETGEFSRVDMIAFSAHKIHGPKGIGALCVANPRKTAPLIRGGGQESGIRSGTQNVPGIAGFGAAARLMSPNMSARARHVAALRQRLLDGIIEHISDVMVLSPRKASESGHPGFCSPYILSVSFLGTRGEVLVHDLERNGIFVSTGAACATLKKSEHDMNPVLAALGLSKEEAEGALRFSFSGNNTEEEIDYTLEHLKAAVERFRKIGKFRNRADR
jgi:cysteine desulfurase